MEPIKTVTALESFLTTAIEPNHGPYRIVVVHDIDADTYSEDDEYEYAEPLEQGEIENIVVDNKKEIVYLVVKNF